MSDPTPAEERKLGTILEALALAIRRSDEIDSSSVEKTSDLKIQKFGHEALAAYDELDEVTHSWYIAGAKADVPKDVFGKKQFVETYDRMGATDLDDSTFIDGFERYEPSEEVQKYATYFTDRFDLDDVWFTKSDYFLRDFYLDMAPPKYRDLYVAVQELRIQLKSTIGELSAIVGDSSQVDLSDFGQETPVMGPDRYDEIAKTVSEIHLELGMDEQLQRTLPLYRAFTDVLEDAYLALSKLDVSRLDETQLQAFKALSNFHYYEAWKLPSLVISMETARGPRAQDLQVRKARELQTHMENLEEEIEDIWRTCSDAGLIPAVADYPATETDDESLDDLIELYVESAE